ncbi:MAG: class I SAM-dependent methyltransferase, partial [Actinobacteria bacterium]|nr:class I SAM-dependent methyltransferase [Actinomycetota bacterium]
MAVGGGARAGLRADPGAAERPVALTLTARQRRRHPLRRPARSPSKPLRQAQPRSQPQARRNTSSERFLALTASPAQRTIHSSSWALLGRLNGRSGLAVHPVAELVGVDSSEQMLAAAGRLLDPDRVDLHSDRIEDPLPPGPFDLVVAALVVHHLEADDKAKLFQRVNSLLRPGGRFVLADV